MAHSSRSEFEVSVHYGREVEEAGVAGHIAATIKKQSVELPVLSSLSSHGPGSQPRGTMNMNPTGMPRGLARAFQVEN